MRRAPSGTASTGTRSPEGTLAELGWAETCPLDLLFASVLAACALARAALADPVLECGVRAQENVAVGDCLRTQLDIVVAPP